MVMQGEGHGFRSPVNVGLFYQAVLAFFEKNLKPAEAKPEPAGKLP
jgi:dipeptidyl aminopeptidase/acylaminoacyl peptidase